MTTKGKGTTVRWRWGAAMAEGKVRERFARRVQRTIKGTKVVKNGTPDNPALLIEQDDGGLVLKRQSELI